MKHSSFSTETLVTLYGQSRISDNDCVGIPADNRITSMDFPAPPLMFA